MANEVPQAPEYQVLPGRPEPAAADAAGAEHAPTVVVLRGPEADIYLEVLRKLVKAGRLNQFYPNPTSLERLYYFMGPTGTRGLEEQIKLNPRNGMPSEPDIGRVLADRDACERFLQKNDLPEVLARTDEASQRLKRRIEYFRELSRAETPRRVRLEMKLRSVDHTRKMADFITLFERYDPGEGVFTRYTVSLTHEHSRWNRSQIELQGDDLQYTEAFRNVISRYHSDEAEFAFVLLSDVPGIKVREVVRGRVGPLWFKDAQMPPDVAAFMQDYPGDFILHFPLERVEVTATAKADLNCDPFARFYRHSLDPEARELADRRAEALGYRVYKERKFACTRNVAEPFKKFLAERGGRCVMYPV